MLERGSPDPPPRHGTSIVLTMSFGCAGVVADLIGQGRLWWAAAIAGLAATIAITLEYSPNQMVAAILLATTGLVALPLGHASMGATPVAVTLGASSVAWAASTRTPRHLPSFIRLDRIVTTTLPPLAAAQIWWLRHRSAVPIIALVVVAVMILAAAHRWPQGEQSISRFVTRLVRRVLDTVAAVVILVFATLLLYIPGAVTRVIRHVVSRPSEHPEWNHGRVRHGEARQATLPFTPASPITRFMGTATTLVVVVVIIVSAVVVSRRPPSRTVVDRAEPVAADVFEQGRRVRLSSLAAFADQPFADDLKAEQDTFSNERLVASPVGGYDIGDFRGRFTNVSARERFTPTARCTDCPRGEIWIMGGSAAFGLGQRDGHTIAAELSRIAATDGLGLVVHNFGVPGWTIHQEVQKLESLLDEEDRARPTMVIFLDGYNDVLGSIIASTVHGLDADRPTLMTTEDIVQFSEGAMDPWRVATTGKMARLTADAYERERRRAHNATDAHDTTSMFFFQPDALASPAQYREVRHVYDLGDEFIEYAGAVLERTVELLGSEVHDLRHLLDDEGPSFADLVHTNEAAATIVAGSVYDTIAQDLRRLLTD